MRRGKNAELVLKDTLTLYGEVLALGKDWVELESQMGRVRVKAPCKHLEGLVEGQVVGVRVLARLARRRGRWEILGRPDLIEDRGPSLPGNRGQGGP
jgi:hypothetical protein